MNPPSVYELTIPSIHNTTSRTKIVINIVTSFSNPSDCRVRAERVPCRNRAGESRLCRTYPMLPRPAPGQPLDERPSADQVEARQAGTIRVVRREPAATSSAKITALVIDERV